MRTVAVLVLLALPVQGQDEQALVGHLNQAIAWYRRVSSQAGLANEPSDVMFVEQNRLLARQAVAQAFDGARGLAELRRPAQQQAPLSKRAGDADAAVQKAQADVDAAQKRLAEARPKDRAALEQQLAENRSELSLAQARAQALKAMTDFSSQVGSGAAGLAGQIDELERAVPEVRAQAQQNAPAAAVEKKPPAQGVLALLEELFSLARKEREIHETTAQAVQLRAANEKLRAPLSAQLKDTLQKADQVAAAPDSPVPAVMADRRRQLDGLTGDFKRISAALLPLGKEAVLLDAARANLVQWDNANDSLYASVLRALAVRAALLAALIALLLSASALWRRATYRLVHDPRRRQVSMLVRRIVITGAIAVTIVLSLANEIGSLATFAGFITAGLAVALQNVILSMAAYFFLIGKYGLRVGERVQIGAVVGDVLEIGLVRLHVLETGIDGLPTGRVVVFSNSIAFQGPNLFKPLPGTSFAWHEIKLTLAATADHALAEQEALQAVQQVVDGYRSAIERQHAEIQEEMPLPLQPPKPQTRLKLTEAGLEMHLRYPVPLEEAAAADDRVTRALLQAFQREPRLKLAGAAATTLQ